jgi:SAM-dependent methyltransferase
MSRLIIEKMRSEWMIDEHRHSGDEHLDPEAAARFDDKLPFDPSSEVDILMELGLSSEDTIVDFGTGTGVFPLAVAGHCERVVAVDVSKAMLEVVRERMERSDIRNIETIHEGFLSYDHRGMLASFAFSKDALHHLPDFWKVEALKNVGRTLKDGGIFRLRDFVFSFEPSDSLEEIETWIDENKESTSFTDEEIYRHFREEYSTYGFVLEPMLEQVGFEILESKYAGEFYAEYSCRWQGSRE